MKLYHLHYMFNVVLVMQIDVLSLLSMEILLSLISWLNLYSYNMKLSDYDKFKHQTYKLC